MGSILNVNIYGLKARINCLGSEEKEDVARLLSLFLKDETEEAEVILDFRKKETGQEIGCLLFPHLARKGIWAMHSGGFHFHGGHLTTGPSDCGKSTFSHMAMKNGFDLLSDDITLLRETPDGVEMLPFYSTMYMKSGTISPERERYKPATLKFLILPKVITPATIYVKDVIPAKAGIQNRLGCRIESGMTYDMFNCRSNKNGSIFLNKVKKKIDLLRKLVPQFLWSYNRDEQKRQKRFLEMMCHYPAYEVYWGSGLFHDHTLFRMILDEIVQSEG